MLPPRISKSLPSGNTILKIGAKTRAQGAAKAATSAADTILVVDDDEAIRKLVAAILEAHGYAVLTAEDAFQGLGVLRKYGVDLLITESALPVCSGLELANRVRDSWPGMPILFMCGDWAESTSEMPGGPSSLICKPFSIHKLVDRVDELLKRSREEAQPMLSLSRRCAGHRR
jgi:DNA-binding response OmpR family regulator